MANVQSANEERTIANVRVGDPDVKPTQPSHVRGVAQGNARGATESQGMHEEEGGLRLHASGRRSTGINPDDREPILPGMPVLTPP